jgi:hypothetical protein
VHQASKSRHVIALQTVFLEKIEQLRLQHASVTAVKVPLPHPMDVTAAPVPPLPDVTSAAAQVPRLLSSMDVPAAAQVPPLPQPMDLAAAVQETPREMHLRKARECAKRNYCEHGKQRSKCQVCRPQQELKLKAAALSADSPIT